MSAWAYLVLFNEKLGKREDLTSFLDTLPEVTYWYACLPNAVFFTATVNAASISKKIQDHFGTGEGQRFLVSEVHDDRQGWLPKTAWHMFKNPENPKLPK